ncbi:NADP-dependent isocitrate dehydrogenase [Angelakisella massiliensis]|uniref:NADP-dependent isocitrate dehydrogenase n=1 Tax=Angelakisella massiliensis TaxID=1871018 RepID=UPI0008F89E54|nr:NADP-dependent isocitrate dehydrogenase [Angelakisella massiliensis]
MKKVPMFNPIVEMDGDEMTRVLWKMIKDELILPFVDLKTEYYDLGLPNRDATNDQVTVDAANAIKVHHVGVKCSTITANLQRMQEYSLKKMWRSPNATIRAALDGTVFRTPILLSKIKPVVGCWERPVTIARHAYGDVYKAVEYRVPGAGKAELVFTDENGNETYRRTVAEFDGPGVLQAMHNRNDSIESFARACFEYALDRKEDLWFSTKDTISKEYDQTFKLIFQRIYDEEYRDRFEKANIKYFYTLIDDAAAKVIRSKGGMIWACKNYDGDVMSDLVAAAAGSLPMMSSVLVSPDGNFEYEAAHGTITDHYYRYLKGEAVSSNPLAIIFSWSGALRKRGELDNNSALMAFADALEDAGIQTMEEGILSQDLAILCDPADVVEVPDNAGLLKAIRSRLEANLAAQVELLSA